jgi:hypothetical protein
MFSVNSIKRSGCKPLHEQIIDLIKNESVALDKLRCMIQQDKKQELEGELAIRITLDKPNNTLRIEHNGIGMTQHAFKEISDHSTRMPDPFGLNSVAKVEAYSKNNGGEVFEWGYVDNNYYFKSSKTHPSSHTYNTVVLHLNPGQTESLEIIRISSHLLPTWFPIYLTVVSLHDTIENIIYNVTESKTTMCSLNVGKLSRIADNIVRLDNGCQVDLSSGKCCMLCRLKNKHN